MVKLDVTRGHEYIEARYKRDDGTNISFHLTRVVYESRGAAGGQRDVLTLFNEGEKIGELVRHRHGNDLLRVPCVGGGTSNYVNVGTPKEFYNKITRFAFNADIYEGPEQ